MAFLGSGPGRTDYSYKLATKGTKGYRFAPASLVINEHSEDSSERPGFHF